MKAVCPSHGIITTREFRNNKKDLLRLGNTSINKECCMLDFVFATSAVIRCKCCYACGGYGGWDGSSAPDNI
jgi:hypothetical protein